MKYYFLTTISIYSNGSFGIYNEYEKSENYLNVFEWALRYKKIILAYKEITKEEYEFQTSEYNRIISEP